MAKNEVSVKINFIGDVNQAVSSIDRLKNHLKTLKIDTKSSDQLNSIYDKIITKQKELQTLQGKETFNKKDIDNIRQLEAELESLQKTYLDIAKNASKGGIISNTDVEKINQLTNQFEKLKEGVVKAKKSLSDAETELQNHQNSANKAAKQTQEFKDKLNDLKQNVENAKNILQETNDKALKEFKDSLNDLAKENDIKINTDGLKDFEKASEWINKFESSLSKTKLTEQQIITIRRELEAVSKKYNLTQKEATHSYEEQTQAARELDQVNSRLTSFFSVASGIRFLSKAVKDSISTIKELDAVMTQAAVVTNYDVNDMWEKLPQFTDQANKLGVATKEAYSAMTLYVQQGLDLNTATSLATETLKMARIASLDASTATDRVTNAIRAFNMEINEDSARRVADVYSNLAAKSASNVNELSVAMTKVASIASSANMSFEKTAAFLAQGIETTRESAETIGTMLKTVVGRIGEVKKLYSQGDLMGTDEEGGTIDVNKVSKAFRTAGINLNEFFLGQKGLDDILLELAEKWNTLDLVHQRYIATQAAGSRQQSRFIALLQDYARTQELVSYAENAAGASNEQYEKTLDSIESKLNQLKNAWDSFTMGIANNKLVKGGVSTLTGLLNILNKLTSSLGVTGGLLTKLTIAVGGFFAGGKLVRTFMSSLTNIYGSGQKGLQGFGESLGINILTGMKTIFSKEGWNSIGSIFSKSSLVNDLGSKFRQNFDNSEWKNLTSGTISQVRSKIKDSTRIPDEFKEQVEQDYVNQQKQAILGLASACGIGAIALSGLSKAAEAFGNTKLASSLQIVSQTLGVMIPILVSLPPIIEAIKKATNDTVKIPLGGITAIIAAIAGLITIIRIVSALTENAKEKTESLKNAYQDVAKAADKAKQSYDNLKTSLEDYHKAQDGINGLVEGTKEFNEALIEANSQVLELLDKYPELAQYLQRGVNGLLSFSDEGLDKIVDITQQRYYNAAGAQLALSIANNQNKVAGWNGFSGFTMKGGEYGSIQAPEEVFRKAFVAALEENAGKENVSEEVYEALSNQGFITTQGRIAQLIQDYQSHLDEVTGGAIANENQYASLVSLSLTNGGVESDYVQAAASGVSKKYVDYLSTDLQARVDALTDNENELKQKYKELFGSETDLTGNDLKRAVAAGQLGGDKADLAEIAVKAFEQLAQVNEESANNLSSILTKSLTEEQLNLFGEGGKEGFSALGISANDIKFIGESLGYTGSALKEFREQLEASIKEQIRYNNQTRISLMQTLSKTGINLNDITSLVTTLTIEDIEITQDVFDKLNLVLTDGISKDLSNLLVSGLKEGNITADELDWLNDWNPNNAVNAADQLRKKIKEITNAEGEAIEGKEELFKAYNLLLKDSSISLNKQLNEVYSEINEDLDKIIDKGKEINSDAIEDLAKEGSALDKILKQDGVTIQGLARLFSALKSNGITSFEGITDRVIKAVSSVNTLDDSLKESFERLSGFKEFDRGEGMDTLKSLSDKTKEYIENYEYGNASDILKEFYGNEWYENEIRSKTGAEREQALRQKASEMQHLTSNDGYNAFWQAYQNNGDFKSKYGLEVKGSDVSLNLDLIKQNKISIEDLSEDLAKELGITVDAAKALVGTFTARNDELEDALNEGSFTQAIDKFSEDRGAKVVTDAEVQAFASAFGYTFEEGSQKFIDAGYIVAKTLNLSSDELIKSIDEVRGKLGKTLSDFLDSYGNISVEKATEELSQYGFSQEEIETYLNNLAKAEGLDLSQQIISGYNEAGEAIYTTITAKTTDALKSSVEDAYAEADASVLASQIGLELGKALETADFKSIGRQIAEGFYEQLNGGSSETNTENQHIEKVDTKEVDDAKKKLQDLKNVESSLLTQISLNVDPTKVDDLYNRLVKVRDLINALSGKQQTLQRAVLSVGVFPNGFASGGSVDSTGPALTGELGTEMVVRNGQWFTVGDKGPEIANLKKGDIVFNANQTKDLLTKGKTSTRGRALASGTAYAQTATSHWGSLSDPVPNYYGNSNDAAKSAASAASSAKDAAKVWLNTLDKLYNLVELIEEETRRRELLERQFERIQRNQNQTLIEIRDNYEAQLNSLDLQLEYQKQLQKGRLAQINDVANERYKMGDSITTYAGSGATRYARYNQSTNTIQIDWDAINAITDEDLGNAVEAYIKRLEELQGQYEDTYKVICDIEDDIYDLQQAYRDAYKEFGDRVHDALVNSKQSQIDQLKDFSDTLSNEQSAILDALNEQIELERRIRDNTEKESEIADKEQQLAYLRRDTSSGNQKAIQQLEKEISDLKQDYRDTLIDQKLDELSNENEKAQAAREKQIELLQAQLDYDKAHGAFWSTVESLITSAFNPDGTMNASSDLVRLLQDTDGFKALSDIAQDSWMLDLAAAFQMSAKGLENWKVSSLTTQAIANGASITTADGSVLTYNKSTGKWEAGDSQFDISYNAQTGQYSAINGEKIMSSAPEEVTTPTAAAAAEPATTQAQKTTRTFNDDIARGIAAAIWVFNDTGSGWDYDGVRLTQKFGAGARARVQQIINAQGPNGQLYNYWASRGYDALAEYRYSAFKMGGLADYTGFAWLDGTRSNPEVVLDAEDSRNFIQLRDILRNFGTSNSFGGETYIDVKINVDEIGSDYDVERLAEKVKDEIYRNAQYRNVNALNFIR